MTQTHTPGPWDIHSGARGLEIHPLSDAEGESPIADVLTGEPDARLIAAAPAMLAALQELVTANYGQPWGVTVPALDNARAAIAAATGTPTDETGEDCETCAAAIETRLAPCDECGAIDGGSDDLGPRDYCEQCGCILTWREGASLCRSCAPATGER